MAKIPHYYGQGNTTKLLRIHNNVDSSSGSDLWVSFVPVAPRLVWKRVFDDFLLNTKKNFMVEMCELKFVFGDWIKNFVNIRNQFTIGKHNKTNFVISN